MLVKKERFGEVWIVIGIQLGSEGKGAITNYLSPAVSLGVRSGAANAGHTFYYQGKQVMRQIPSVWTNPLADLVIGRGALISLDVLLAEIEFIEKIIPIRHRLFIDPNAHVITEEQIEREAKSDLAKRIGSTSATSREGIGTAAADKVLRKESCLQAKNSAPLRKYLADTIDMINTRLENDDIVLIEGTQGYGLSLDHGFFPYVTSRDTSVPALAASVGVSLHEFPVNIIGVVRTYPIRVAGNSGPFGDDCEEISWQEVTRRAKSPVPIIESTTVTKKVRRVATFSQKNFLEAVRVNRPTELAVTFADYLDSIVYETEKISDTVEQFLDWLEEISQVKVGLIKTGPKTTVDFNHYRRSMLRRLN